VDFATFENPDTPRLLKSVPNVETYIQQTPSYFRLDVSAIQETSPFKDDRLRKAMSYAIDRERIVQIVFGGDSKPEYLVPAAFNRLRPARSTRPIRCPGPSASSSPRTS
jgi:peptide/nickel transport system substrate-binding protein